MVGTSPRTENIAGRIDARLHTKSTHELHRIIPAGNAGIRETDTSDAVGESAALWPSIYAESLQTLPQAIRVDAQARGGPLGETQVRESCSNGCDGEAGE